MSDLSRLGHFSSALTSETKSKMLIFYFNFGIGNLDPDSHDKVQNLNELNSHTEKNYDRVIMT